MAAPDTPKPPVYPNHVHDTWGEEIKRRRDAEMAERLAGSFRLFMPRAWPTVEPARAYIKNWHMDAMAEHAQAVADGQIKKLVVNISPGASKSLVWSVLFPAWMWCPHRNPGWRSTFASYDAVLSTRDSVRCRSLLNSVWYQETFQPDWKFATDQNVKTYFVNSAAGHRFSTSVGATSTGFRGDAIIVDDAMKAGDRNSDAAIAAVIDWWTNEMFNRLNSMATGSKVIIMQRLSDRDLTAHVLREGGFEHLLIPMEYDPARSKVTSIGWKDPRREHGELMFPQLFPKDVIDQELKKDASTYAAQYQQTPNVDGGGILKSHRWNYWQPPGANLPPVRVKLPDGSTEERVAIPLPAHFDKQIQSWDCAFKDLKDSDFVCGQVHAVRGAQRFILDQDMRRMGITETMAAIRTMSGRHPGTHLKLVEDKANGSAVVEMLEKEISGLTRVEPKGPKVGRAQAASPEQEAGNWFLPHPLVAPWVGNPENPAQGGFLASTTLFPFGANDDDVDAWSQGAIRIQHERIGGEFSISDQDIRVEQFEIDAKWPRLYGVSIDWREFGVVWLARRPETETCYLYNDYFAPSGDPALHVSEVKKVGEWIQGAMHPDEVGRDEQAGYALMSRYSKLGLHLFSEPRDVAAEITDLQEALRSGKLKVFGNLGRFWDQYLCFRRDQKGKLPEQNTALIRAMMVAWRARDKMRGPAQPSKTRPRMFMESSAPSNTWMKS